LRYDALITPVPSWTHWDNDAQAIHGIARDRLVIEGKPAVVVATELNHLLAGKTVVCDCLRWDAFWMDVLYGTVGITPTFTLEDVTALLTDRQLAIYCQDVERLLASGDYRHHQAGDDAAVIQRALQSVLAMPK